MVVGRIEAGFEKKRLLIQKPFDLKEKYQVKIDAHIIQFHQRVFKLNLFNLSFD